MKFFKMLMTVLYSIFWYGSMVMIYLQHFEFKGEVLVVNNALTIFEILLWIMMVFMTIGVGVIAYIAYETENLFTSQQIENAKKFVKPKLWCLIYFLIPWYFCTSIFTGFIVGDISLFVGFMVMVILQSILLKSRSVIKSKMKEKIDE